MFSKNDVAILRSLSKEVKAASEKDNKEEKIAFWTRHTSLQGEVPAVFVHPDYSYNELIPWNSLSCKDSYARQLEMQLRKVIFHSKYLPDDVPILDTITVDKVIHNTWWGIKPKHQYDASGASFKHVPIIETPDDWHMLSKPIVTYDAEATALRYEEVCNAVGDILKPQLCGITDFGVHLFNWYCNYRGLDNLLIDLVLEPEMVHETMRFFTDGYIDMFRQMEAQGLISLNNDNTYHYTGGVGYCQELPSTDFDPLHVKLCDVWGSAESQEFAVVSPQMHEEFALQYEREILTLFGLNGYGCCDDLSHKLDGVLKIKNLRRVAICPWADIGEFTPILKNRYLMTWKPHPSYLAMDHFPADEIRKELSTGIRKARGGRLELILRDTSTVRMQPERFTEWISIARESIAQNWD